MLYPTIWSNNGEVFSEDGKQILIDSPESIQAIQRLADLRNKDMVMSAPGLTEYNSTSKGRSEGASPERPDRLLCLGPVGASGFCRHEISARDRRICPCRKSPPKSW